MLKVLAQYSELAAAALMSVLKATINDYCDLETTTSNSLVAKDGSEGTILRYNGFRSLVGRKEYGEFTQDFSDTLNQFFSARGHQTQIVYFRDDDASDEVDRFLQPCYETAQRLGMQIGDILDEKRDINNRHCLDEQVYIILWTRPAVLDPAEHKLSKKQRDELLTRYKMPSMPGAQSLTRPIAFMADRHRAYVEKVVNDIRSLKGSVEVFPVHEAFRELKRRLHKNTPKNWKPILPGDTSMMYRWKNDGKKTDVSAVMYPRLDDQLFTAPAFNGNKKGIGGVTDTQAVRIGTRIFAPVHIKLPPRRDPSPMFSSLFTALNNAGSKGRDGAQKQIPWALSFMIEGDGLKGLHLRKIVAQILSITSQSNRDLRAACERLSQQKANGDGSNAKMQISALTWVDAARKDADDELLIRRSKLSSALQGWGDCVVEEETGDPTEATLACMPGMMLKSPANAAAVPLEELPRLLPLSRPASPFHRGSSLFRTLDGKLMPYEVFSNEQPTWITTIFGGPGSGKSVLANRLNAEMCLLGGLQRLPFICVIDIGISSSGFISLVQDSLPEHQKHLAIYKRIQNTDQYGINMFDTSLGMREPLPREREQMKNFLVRLATPPDRAQPHKFMSTFVSQVIDSAFRSRSDRLDTSQPAKYVPSQNDVVREAVERHGIQVKPNSSTWWDVVDALHDKGLDYEASVAQRYAVPALTDMLTAGTDQELVKQYSDAKDDGMPVADEFRLMLTAAQSDFPIFRGQTQFDIGESRVMALDLQDVVTTGSASARKQASLMYMAAINAFTRKINVIAEDLPLIPERYRRYHAKRVDELAQDVKRLFCDEYHKTGDDPNLRESFLIFGRESRKWMMEIVLGSQLAQDFRELAQIATTILILDQGNASTRRIIKEIFGLTDTEEAALRGFVKGPLPGIGMTFLAKFKTVDGEMSQLFTATSGGLELWGLSTTAEDRALRNKLYAEMPAPTARRLLKGRFPTGSCKKFVQTKKQESQIEQGDQFVDDDAEASIIDKLAIELIGQWKKELEQQAIAA
jgi:intracellular multiplication protein IcmB